MRYFSSNVIKISIWVIALFMTVGSLIIFQPGDLFGVRRRSQDQRGPVLAKVGDREITEVDVERLRRSVPSYFSFDDTTRKQIDQVLLSILVDDELLYQSARRIPIANSEVREAVDRFVNQQFGGDQDTFRAYLASQGLHLQGFRDLQRRSLQVDAQRQRIQDSTQVSEAEIRQYYLNHREEQYRRPYQIKAREIVVTDQALAAQLYGQLVAGADFERLARERSTVFADQGGSLGGPEQNWITTAIFEPAVGEQVAALLSGQFTRPIKVEDRFFIVKIEDRRPAGFETLEEVRSSAESAARRLKGGQALEQWLEEQRQRFDIQLSSPAVATVNDQEITQQDLTEYLVFVSQVFSQIDPRQISPEFMQSLQRIYLDQLIAQELELQYARAQNLPVIGTKVARAREVDLAIMSQADVSPEEIQQYYNSHLQDFTRELRARLRQITVPETPEDGNALAKSIHQQLSEGADFATLAQEHSTDDLAEQGGNRGWVARSVLSPIVATGVFQTPVGGISDVLCENGTCQIFQVLDIDGGTTKPLVDVENDIRSQLIGPKRSARLEEWRDNLRAAGNIVNNLSSTPAAQSPGPEAN
ncbi:MAG: peptidyl-prolyl cis-trans isomerase [Deinococcus sp.]|nr:peptidyl-prolyl cis-trans isomerase [Deinococcus sp.]